MKTPQKRQQKQYKKLLSNKKKMKMKRNKGLSPKSDDNPFNNTHTREDQRKREERK